MGAKQMILNMCLAMIVAITIAIIAGKVFIPLLHKLKFGQTVREEGPKSHVKKNGTPTMGGVIFILAIVVGSLLYVDIDLKSQYPMIALVLFSLVGFADDFLKIKRGKNLGLTAKQKMILLFIVSFTLSLIGQKIFGTEMYIPFVRKTIDLGMIYIPFMMFVYIGASNAVNLTDGLDGLASSVTVFVLLFLGIIANSFGFSNQVMFVVVSIGALIGFLFFNINPAKVFMGDTGSLGLGGMVVAMTVQMSMPLILILVGIMYIVETMSVILQVISFKTTGKRIFKMSPIHHHYEMCGLSENKIVMLFSAITIVFGIIAVFSI